MGINSNYFNQLLKIKCNFFIRLTCSCNNFLSLPLIKKITLLSFSLFSLSLTGHLSPLSHYSPLSPISAQSLLVVMAKAWKLKVTAMTKARRLMVTAMIKRWDVLMVPWCSWVCHHGSWVVFNFLCVMGLNWCLRLGFQWVMGHWLL